MARPWSDRFVRGGWVSSPPRGVAPQTSIGPPAVLQSGHFFGAGSFILGAWGAGRNLAAGEGGLGPTGFRFMVRPRAIAASTRLGPPGFRVRVIDFRGPAYPFLHQLHGSARALLERTWSALATGVASQREGSRQKQPSGPRRAVNPALFSGMVLLYPWRCGGCRRNWRGEAWPPSGRLDLDVWFRPARG